MFAGPKTMWRSRLVLAVILCPVLIAGNAAKKSWVVIGDHEVMDKVHAVEAMGGGNEKADETFPRKNEILAIMRKVNSYQVAHPVVETTGSGQPITDPLQEPWPRACGTTA